METKAYINRLRRIKELNKKDKDYTNRDLYRWFCKEIGLIEAYKTITNKREALIIGIGDINLEEFGKEKLDELVSKLRSESWQPQSISRALISKATQKEKRLLAVQEYEQKIVQLAVYQILEAIYEVIFVDSSYGSRPKRGCHTGLKDISQKYDDVSFVIEGHIKRTYDQFNHKTLINLLRKKISDKRFLTLIWKLLKAGCMDVTETRVKAEIYTSQRSILFPILANIYLHEFDVYMKEYVTTKKSFESKPKILTEIKLREKIKDIESKLKAIADGPQFKDVTKEELLKELHKLEVQTITSNSYQDLKIQIFYHRYVDTFIIGVAGSKKFAESLKINTAQFLEEKFNLALNQDQTKITNIRQFAVFFFGHEILIERSVVKIRAPMQKVVNHMHLKGFCDGEGKPTPKRNWISQQDNQIVSLFNATIRGYFDFYRGCHNQHSLGRIWYIMRYSCAMTLASKHKSSISKIFKKHGKDIEIKYGMTSKQKLVKLYKPEYSAKTRKFIIDKEVKDPYALLIYKKEQKN